jgi:hypothetical protein
MIEHRDGQPPWYQCQHGRERHNPEWQLSSFGLRFQYRAPGTVHRYPLERRVQGGQSEGLNPCEIVVIPVEKFGHKKLRPGALI